MAYNLLKGKKGIIFGALNEQSIAWKVAQRAVQEGAEIILSNAPIALRMGELNKLAEECNAPVIGADVTSNDDIVNLFEKSQEHFGGGVDFVLHSVGMSINVRKGITYTEDNYDFTHKGLDISALSLHRILQTAMEMDAINEWGSVPLRGNDPGNLIGAALITYLKLFQRFRFNSISPGIGFRPCTYSSYAQFNDVVPEVRRFAGRNRKFHLFIK